MKFIEPLKNICKIGTDYYRIDCECTDQKHSLYIDLIDLDESNNLTIYSTTKVKVFNLLHKFKSAFRILFNREVEIEHEIVIADETAIIIANLILKKLKHS